MSAVGREVVPRGRWRDYNWRKPWRVREINENSAEMRAMPKLGRSAYKRTTGMPSQRQIDIIRTKATPSRYKSPASPARNECGDTRATSARAFTSVGGSAHSNVSRSHRCRSARRGISCTTGEKTRRSPTCRNCSKCQCMMVAAVNRAATEPP